MGILWLLIWRSNDLLEQIRRNQLTLAERAKEDKERDEEECAWNWILLITFSVPLLGLISFHFLR